MHKSFSATLAAAAAFGALAAPARANEAWYGRADLGWGFAGGAEAPAEVSFTPPFGGGGDLEGGIMGALGAGYRFDSGLNVEAELSYRDNDIEPSIGVRPGAEARALALLANAIYEFNADGRLRPFIGAGVGLAQIEASTYNNFVAPADRVGFDDETTAFAYQLMAGLAVPLGRNLTLDLAFRHFAAPDLKFDGRGSAGVPRSFSLDYEHQALTTGVRFRLGG